MNWAVAIVSDVHANLEACRAVIADIGQKGVSRILCLGDLVGYGSDPAACMDLARAHFSFVIRGNHDQAVTGRVPRRFKHAAKHSTIWTRRVLRPPYRSPLEEEDARWAYLEKLPDLKQVGQWLFAHGSPMSNLEYIYDPRHAGDVISRLPSGISGCFVGHTHMPGVFFHEGRGRVRFHPAEPLRRYSIRHKRFIVNVGSVGQPRDGDPRACWVLLRSNGTVTFRRVPYEIDATARKIVEAGLPAEFADRLWDGS